MGVLIGGLGGRGIGALAGAAGGEGGLGGKSTNEGLGAIAGFIIGAPIDAAIGSSNKQHLIQGDREKFRLLQEKMNKKLWTLKTSRATTKK